MCEGFPDPAATSTGPPDLAGAVGKILRPKRPAVETTKLGYVISSSLYTEAAKCIVHRVPKNLDGESLRVGRVLASGRTSLKL